MIRVASWKYPLLYGAFSALHAGIIASAFPLSRPVGTGFFVLASLIFCLPFIFSWMKKDTIKAARFLFICALFAMHAAWSWWGHLSDWTSVLMYAALESPCAIAVFFLFDSAEPVKGTRTAYTFLCAKTILLDLWPFWYSGPGGMERPSSDAFWPLPPLDEVSFWPFMAIQCTALGIYVYKLTDDPARWRKSIWV